MIKWWTVKDDQLVTYVPNLSSTNSISRLNKLETKVFIKESTEEMRKLQSHINKLKKHLVIVNSKCYDSTLTPTQTIHPYMNKSRNLKKRKIIYLYIIFLILLFIYCPPLRSGNILFGGSHYIPCNTRNFKNKF